MALLADARAFSGFAAPDLDAADAFYAGLGVRTSRNAMGILTLHLAGGTDVIVYPKPDHEPASFTVLNFPVEDVGAAVAALAERGIEVIRYPDAPQDADGVMRGNGPDIAWFADPAGNVLSLIKLE